MCFIANGTSHLLLRNYESCYGKTIGLPLIVNIKPLSYIVVNI